jgi:hypothetical protein
MERFSIPKRAVDQIRQEAPSGDCPAERAPSEFTVPDQVISDIGKIAGDTTDANELLREANLDEQALEPEPTEEPEVEEERSRASRDFSFTGGETSHMFDNLSRRRKKRAINLRAKLVEKYGSRGVNGLSVGLLCVNGIERSLRTNGAVMFAGDKQDYDEYYLVHMGTPLSNNRSQDGALEYRSSYIRYRGLKRPVVDFKISPVRDYTLLGQRMGGSLSYWLDALPKPADDEWSPTVSL